MNGKQKCKILKEIRAEIARNNDIEFVTSECKHKGDCLGTCPKCEAELRYLEKELEKRQRLGKTVAVAGLTASITLSAAGCTDWIPKTTNGMMQPSEQVEPLSGDIAPESIELPGAVPPETEPEDTRILAKGELPSSDTEMLAGIMAPPEDLWEGELVDENRNEDETK